MVTDTEIANLALSHLGVGVEISDLATENSPEAKACRRFMEPSRRQTLRDFPWTFASKQSSLGLVTVNPTTEWAYSYTYPSDCLEFRRILSGIRRDSRQTKIPFKIVYGTASREIYTDMKDAVGEYTVDVTETGRIPDDCAMAISFRLAAYIAPRVTGGDPFKLGVRALQLYQHEVAMARANSVNEQKDDSEPEAEGIRGRE
jgi:hypothetical protein